MLGSGSVCAGRGIERSQLGAIGCLENLSPPVEVGAADRVAVPGWLRVPGLDALPEFVGRHVEVVQLDAAQIAGSGRNTDGFRRPRCVRPADKPGHSRAARRAPSRRPLQALHIESRVNGAQRPGNLGGLAHLRGLAVTTSQERRLSTVGRPAVIPPSTARCGGGR